MKNTFLIFVLLSTFSLQAQSFDFQYDHYSMIVEDLSTTGDFYKEILGLKEIPHPTNAAGFRWFSIHGNSQLHLIKKETVERTSNKSVHLCLATKDLQKFITHLKSKNIPFWDWPGTENAITNREDGVQQIYLKDPEGNWVEINTADHL
jgi:catechol-2,3-dioxygenase